MKRIIILNVVLIILFFSVDNNNLLNISSVELMGTGYDYSSENIHLYNYILNISSLIVYIFFIQYSIVSINKLKYYIVSRGGCEALKLTLFKNSLINVLIIIFAKQLVYFLNYFMSSDMSFYYFDMISSFITLTIYSIILIIFKIINIKDSILSLLFISTIIISQFASYRYSFFSYIVIASYNWRLMYSNIILFKSLLLMLFAVILFKLNKVELL